MPKRPRDIDHPEDVPVPIWPGRRPPLLQVEAHWTAGSRTRAWDELWSRIFASLDISDVAEEKAA